MDAIREAAATFWRETFLRNVIIVGCCWYALSVIIPSAITRVVTPHITKVQTAETDALDAVIGCGSAECVEDRLKAQAKK